MKTGAVGQDGMTMLSTASTTCTTDKSSAVKCLIFQLTGVGNL